MAYASTEFVRNLIAQKASPDTIRQAIEEKVYPEFAETNTGAYLRENFDLERKAQIGGRQVDLTDYLATVYHRMFPEDGGYLYNIGRLIYVIKALSETHDPGLELFRLAPPSAPAPTPEQIAEEQKRAAELRLYQEAQHDLDHLSAVEISDKRRTRPDYAYISSALVAGLYVPPTERNDDAARAEAVREAAAMAPLLEESAVRDFAAAYANSTSFDLRPIGGRVRVGGRLYSEAEVSAILNKAESLGLVRDNSNLYQGA